MRGRQAQRLTPRDFWSKITSARFALVRVDRGMLRFEQGIIDAFEERYPRQMFYGTLDKGTVGDSAWWMDNFRTRYGPFKRGLREPESGYYLFEGGAVEGFVDLSRLIAPAEALKQVIAYFDEKLRLRVFDDAPRTARDEAPMRTVDSVSGGPDPFEVLGVESDASDDEIRAAYKEQMKQNHPDKVAHLSPAIRKVAEQQTLAIQGAWEAIRAMRSGKLR